MHPNLEAGVRNLLFQCADIKTGERLLLVGEKDCQPFFDPKLCDVVAAVARSHGIDTTILLALPGNDASEFPEAVSSAMQTADVSLFFSRLGDQVRFIDSPGPGRKIMSYTLTLEHLGAWFSNIDFRVMKQIHDHLLDQIMQSTVYSIKAKNGTDLKATIRQTSSAKKPAISEFSLELFPVMIFPPVNFFDLHGRLVMEHFLLSSSTRAYADSEFYFDSPVTAIVEMSRMIDFEGDQQLIKRLKKQLERAAAITGGDPYCLNSWHTGINPYTFYNEEPYANLERWGTVAYGSPRYTHIHAAGIDPGDISIQLFDATISFDQQIFWEQGKFMFFDQPEVQTLLQQSDAQLPDASSYLGIGL